ncbi:tetratricopeptide repeat protein [Scytonema sp. UIC 10036]|uniref:tetratricopeptide repeat protein n=1 Tax=Scytonema sp. UIC 10036 TaxID=2304196 RepID=UPI0012DAB525|nr:tetratricopeptide repeat protein [Scytonema sp. UIC 10036]MUG98090.1 tetratricopeptide repeat protein [Scytonema sp. UIC 10036]
MKNQFLPATLLVLFSCQTNLLTGSKVLALEDANSQKVNSPLQIASTPANKANPDSLRTISKYYQQGDFQTTVAKLKVYLEAKPNDDLAWTILGNSYEKLKDDKNAESAYTKALKINPKRFEALTGMGILQRKRKNYDAAISYYQKSLAINPNYAQAYTSMSVIALKQNKDKQALEYAKKADEIEKNEPVIAANLALAYHYNGMKDLRDKMTQKAQELGYKNMDVMQKIYSGKMTIRD